MIKKIIIEFFNTSCRYISLDFEVFLKTNFLISNEILSGSALLNRKVKLNRETFSFIDNYPCIIIQGKPLAALSLWD